MAQLEYLTKIMQVIEKIDKEQSENIQACAPPPSTPASWSTCLVADTACSRSRMYSPATAA